MKRASLENITARVLRLFAKVEPEETVVVTVMTLTAFLLLTAYYLLKTVREPLILLHGDAGAELKLYARAAQAFLMAGVVHVYGEVARRVGRMMLLILVFLFFISNLVIFAVLAYAKVNIGLAFFLWVGVFSYTVVAQFWALAADIYTEQQGKRLFPVIGIGSSVGAVAGSAFAKSLVSYGPEALMGTAAVILVGCGCLIVWVERRTAKPGLAHQSRPGHGAEKKEEALSGETAFHLVARDKYLLLIGALVVLLNWVNSSGEYILDKTLLVAAKDVLAHPNAEAYVGAFKADYFAWYNLLGLLLQLFAVSRIIGHLGLRNSLLFLPVFALFGYGGAAFLPVLGILRLVKIGENALEYSLQDTSRHALFLMTSRVEKFVGKTSVDTIAVRIGAIMSSSVALIGGRLGLPIAGFAAINAALSGVWIVVVFAIGKEHQRRTGEAEELLAAEPMAS